MEKREDLMNQELLDKLYGFSYKRCQDSYEAEELCSEIVLAIMKSLSRGRGIQDVEKYIWGIAYRVYATFCEKRRRHRLNVSSISEYESVLSNQSSEVFEALTEAELVKEQLEDIYKEIAFLSRIYREIMICYYLYNESTASIAARFEVKESTVRQRLFFARQLIRKELSEVNERKMVLQPIKIAFIGTGNPVGNDPREKAERSFSQNLIYLCKDKPQTAKELSEALCVPMPFVEEELEIQCGGANGRYGLLKKLDNGKYVINFVLLSKPEYKKVFEVYHQHVHEFYEIVKYYLKESNDVLSSLTHLGQKKKLDEITWHLISPMTWCFYEQVNLNIQEMLNRENQLLTRPFSIGGFVYEDELNIPFYGYDQTGASHICGYESVQFSNIYGEKVRKQFECGHNISQDPVLMMVIKAVKGIEISCLSEHGKEIAAKGIERDYLMHESGVLKPNILVLTQEDADKFQEVAQNIAPYVKDLAHQVAEEILQLMTKMLPAHLQTEHLIFNLLGSLPFFNDLTNQCMATGLLKELKGEYAGESVLLVVKSSD